MNNSTLAGIFIVLVLIIAGMYFYYQGPLGRVHAPASPEEISNQTAPAINVGSNTGVGNFLTDSNGMTLYYFANDTVGVSTCAGACASIWPAFNASSTQIARGLDAADFATITRADGSSQATYRGWPLYRYSKDVNPGDINGQGFGGIWFVAGRPFYTLLLENNSIAGTYLADANGKALYTSAKDTPGPAGTGAVSVCTGACPQTWPPFYTDTAKLVLPGLVNRADFTEVIRADGVNQLAYKGYPLYYYANDANPGDTIGNGFNGAWYVVSPNGFKTSGAGAQKQILSTGPTSVSTGVGGDPAYAPINYQFPVNAINTGVTGTTGITGTTGVTGTTAPVRGYNY